VIYDNTYEVYRLTPVEELYKLPRSSCHLSTFSYSRTRINRSAISDDRCPVCLTLYSTNNSVHI